MNGARQFALAGAGFAEDEDVGIGIGDLPGSLHHAHHRRAVRADRVVALLHFAFERLEAGGHLPDFQLFGCRQAQLLGAAGFDQVIRRAGLHGVHRGIHRRMGGDDDHPHPGRQHTHLLQDVQPVVLAQAQVQKTQVEYLALQDGFGLRRTGRCQHSVAAILQAVTEGAQDRCFVIHQKDAATGVGRLVHECSSRQAIGELPG